MSLKSKILATFKRTLSPLRAKPSTDSDTAQLLTQIEKLKNTPLFDKTWYAEKYLSETNKHADPYEHFLKHAVTDENDPSQDFSSKHYFLTYPDVKSAALNPLVHYIEHGLQEGRIYLPSGFNPSSADIKLTIKLIEESGQFDRAWYLQHYSDVANAELDPIDHYVNNGAREGRNPSQTFFSYFYLSQLREEGVTDINPLLHYIYKGHSSGLRSSPNGLQICPPLPTGKLFTQPTQAFSIAVMAHIFYDDMAHEVAQWLENIPYKFSLLISTTSDEKRLNIIKACNSLTKVNQLDVRVMPNLGRDIAPMIVGFSELCLKHDYVLHIHSKKSPYGSDTEGWFSYCMSHLLDSPLYVESILRKFEQNESLGIAYPPPLPTLRNHLHWESMRPKGEELLERLGIGKDVLNEFPLEFPAGSMIWFRSKALKPLFESDLNWKDFPKEDSQKNGTLAHVIERLFFYIAFNQGQSYEAIRPAAKSEYFPPIISDDKNSQLTLTCSDQPLVSIIIPVYNQWPYTKACLNSIAAYTDPDITPYEIILADDGSIDETTNACDAYPTLIHARTPENLGFLGNCNHAAKKAKGKYLVLLNNDTQVQPNWLEALTETFDVHTNAAIVGSKLVYPDGSLQEAGGIIWQNAGGLNYGRNNNPALPEYCYLKPSDYISGAAIAVDRDFWESLDGFDERFIPAYYEDTDLCFEARKNGYEVYLQPSSLVVHFEGKSHGTDLNSGIKKHQVTNKEKFLQKWKSTLQESHTDGSQLLFARERSMGKKIIAVIDYYLPEYDRHAGARHTLTYIKLLLSQGYVVKYLACFIDNERQINFATELQQLGVETFYPEIFFFEQNWSPWLRKNKEYLDAVLINRPHLYHMHSDACTESGIPILYFCHDLHSLRESREAIRLNDLEKIAKAKGSESEELEIFRSVDFSYTPSQYESNYLKNEHHIANVSYIPLYYNEKPCKDRLRAPQGKRVIFVGGMQHAPNKDAVKWFLDEIWPTILKTVPDANFRLIGAKPSEDIQKLSDNSVSILGGISESSLKEEYENASVIIAPLQYGAGVKGKTLEALQCGIPLVATNIALEGIPGVLDILDESNTPEEFTQSLISALLMTDKEWLNCSNSYTQYARSLLSKEQAWLHFSKGLQTIGL